MEAPLSSAAPQQRAAARAPPASASHNLDAASALRAQLLSGSPLAKKSSSASSRQQQQQLPYEELQRRGRISSSSQGQQKEDDANRNLVVLTGKAAATNASDKGSNDYNPDLSREDFRAGTRKGKTKRKAVDTIGTTAEEANLSIRDMLKAEKEQKESMDEVYARNVARMGSRFKGKELKNHSSTGADEEEYVDMKVFQKQSLTKVASAQRETSRQLAHHDRQTAITSKCWWWMESPSFRKHMLIALGNHVSLIMAPSQSSLFPGNHFYLVPLQHADASVACADDAWNEIARFQVSLRKLYAKEGKDVILMETILGGSGFWQTRLEAIPVPRKKNDAPMFFKQAMLEQAEDWGTHNKVLSTTGKGLRGTVPNKNFNYFFVEWQRDAGFCQIIESQDFPKDFGIDTIAGMLEMDPLRFRRMQQRQSHQEEKQMVLDFLDRWKSVDWTLELEE